VFAPALLDEEERAPKQAEEQGFLAVKKDGS
jgi:hypothetical protein